MNERAGGTSAVVALHRGCRFIGGDTSPYALSYTAARISREPHVSWV